MLKVVVVAARTVKKAPSEKDRKKQPRKKG
jgi:hypothetical protein